MSDQPPRRTLQIQGHRGARGLAPENTLSGFRTTLELGVHGIEFDVGMSSDGELVLYHDLRLNAALTRNADGSWLSGVGPALFHLSFDELRQYDVGRINPDATYATRFPDQVPVDGERIPGFDDYVNLCSELGADNVVFNIEIKVEPEHAALSASPRIFAERIVDAIHAHDIANRSVVQSFWWEVPRAVKSIDPDIKTSCLGSEQSWGDTIQRNLAGASPWTGYDVKDFGGSVVAMAHASGADVWAPWFEEITPTELNRAHDLGIDVITWTVNEKKDMQRLIDMGVDGIISDYPNRLREVAQEKGMTLPLPAGQNE